MPARSATGCRRLQHFRPTVGGRAHGIRCLQYADHGSAINSLPRLRYGENIMPDITTIPVQMLLNRDGKRHYLGFQNSLGDITALNISATYGNGPLTAKLFQAWADEQFASAKTSEAKDTGFKDSRGSAIREGDVLQLTFAVGAGAVTLAGVVVYMPMLGTDFWLRGPFRVGGKWTMLPMSQSDPCNRALKVSNVIDEVRHLESEKT